VRMDNHIGIEKRSKRIYGSSEEYWTMCESVIQLYYVSVKMKIALEDLLVDG